MSVPNQPSPHQQPPTASNPFRTAMIIVLSVGLVAMLCCGGVFTAGALLFVYSKQTLDQVQQAVNNTVTNTPSGWENDWVIKAQLTPLFTAALDAVTESKEVQEKLGESIEPTGEADELYRRERKGPVSMEEETISFDIQGPKGAAVVKVIASNQVVQNQRFNVAGLQPAKITVTLADGTEIDVPPPKSP